MLLSQLIYLAFPSFPWENLSFPHKICLPYSRDETDILSISWGAELVIPPPPQKKEKNKKGVAFNSHREIIIKRQTLKPSIVFPASFAFYNL